MKNKTLTKPLLLVMAIASGIVVANLYYIQPLINEIANYFSIPRSYASFMATMTQIGYATGLFFILPLADIYNRKKLVSITLCCSIGALTGMILSDVYYITTIICFFLGLTSIVPQLMVPFGAQLSEPEERGKNIGVIMSGLMIGTISSRVVSGVLGAQFGWKAVYGVAIFLIAFLVIVLYKALPDLSGKANISYKDSLKSMFKLPRKYPLLLEAAVNGAMLFAISSAFWTVLTFHLSKKPFMFDTGTIGMFGLFGIFGAIFAPIAGRLTDKKGAWFTLLIHMFIILFSILVLGIFKSNIIGIIIGTILINYAINCCNVANQSRIQCLSDEERNRITGIYMVCYFLGGSCGTYIGTYFYEIMEWLGFIGMSIVILMIALILHIEKRKKLNDLF